MMKHETQLSRRMRLLALLALTLWLVAPGLQAQPLRIGLRKQLFVDDYIVADSTNITRELGQVMKANGGRPVLGADKPWENADLFRFGTVIRDGDRFRMWYLMNEDRFGYAESVDGTNWTKPNLGLYECQGSKDNNIVDARGISCFLDPHDTDPQHKYKSAYGHPKKIMACLAHSPDGLRWTDYNNGEPVTRRAADTMNQLLWDEDAQVYRLYTRTDYGQGRYAGTLDENRGTRDMVNPDVKANTTAWQTVREWTFDREGRWEFKRRQVYSLNGWIYEGVHFGLMWCYEWPGQLGEGGYDLHKRHERDVMNFYLVSTRGSPREIGAASVAGTSSSAVISRGEASWDLSWVYAEKPLVPRGPDGSFDKDWVQPAGNIVTWQDQHWIYYCGSRERHDIYRLREGPTRWQCAIGLATLRLDGFVCLAAKDPPGTVVTKPFLLEGGKLEVNLDTKEGSPREIERAPTSSAPVVGISRGEAMVEILNEAGKPIPGFTQQEAKPFKAADGLRLQPRWETRADLATLKGQVVRLKFHLKNARLYAFQIK